MDDKIDSLGLARQPIFDEHLNVVAYELLYHSEQGDSVAKFLQGDQDTCNALVTHFTSIFDAGMMKTLPAFLNVSHDFLRSGSLPNLSHHNLVIDLRKQPITPHLYDNLKNYVDAGFRLVLDDFTYTPEYDELLKIADIVRVDVSLREPEEISCQLRSVSPFNVTCLAENISSIAEYEMLCSQGFGLFQGSFLSRPSPIEGKKISANQAIVIHLLAALQDQEVSAETLSDIASRDPLLTFKLLRIVNSAKYSLSAQVENLTQAIVTLGLNEVNKWATLLALSSNNEKPSELIRQILITARMCEYVAYQTEEIDPDKAFICGILSMLDAYLGIGQQTLLNQLNVADDIAYAIRGFEGKAGKLLQAVNLYMIGQQGFKLPIDVQQIYANAYYDALRWSNETMQIMQGSHL